MPFCLTYLCPFDQYGDVLNLIMSKKKGGSAIVEFASWKDAVSTCERVIIEIYNKKINGK
jgi:hypothetical protein